MITTFGVNAKKYSDLPITYSPHTGFRWRLVSAYVSSSDTGMTVLLILSRNGISVFDALSTTTNEYLDALGAIRPRYAEMDFGSLDGLEITQSGGATGDTVDAVITVEVLPA